MIGSIIYLAIVVIVIAGMWKTFETVSYTHLDVYKRQSVPHVTRPVYVWIVIAPTGFVMSGQLQKRVIRQAESKSF